MNRLLFSNYISKRGFTLIELLVVIAIIGLLATIVLVSLNSARNKANDVAIKAAVSQARSQAELIYDGVSPNSYAGLCNGAVLANTVPLQLIHNGIINNNGGTSEVCSASATAYCVSAIMKTSATLRFCVDSTGKVSNTATAICAAQACPN